jgi:hypothetical protein
MCYLPLRSQFLSTRALRPASSALEAAVMSGPASGRPVLNVAARGRSLFSTGSARVLRCSRVATVALSEFRLNASWSSSASIKSSARAHRAVVVRAPVTSFEYGIALQRSSTERLATRFHPQFRTGLAYSIQGWSGASPARPNPSVEPTPNRVALWPGSGYRVHFPLPSQSATLPGSPHLKR